MPTEIKLKRASGSSDVPALSDLAVGELAINTYHGRLYTEKNDGSAAIHEIGVNPTQLTINGAITFPTSDGSSGQALTTDGSGTLSFSTVGGTGLSVFKYTITSNTTSITGADDDNNSLSYTAGKEQVYLNGVKLIDGGTDYTATNSSTITLAENAINGDVVQVLSYTSTDLVQGNYTTNTFTATTADQVLSSNAVANKTIKYVISATHATAGVHSAEVLLQNNGSNSYFVQYGDVFSASSLFTLDSDISSGNMRLLITPANTNTTVKTFQIRLS